MYNVAKLRKFQVERLRTDVLDPGESWEHSMVADKVPCHGCAADPLGLYSR